jgi:hypothetical protein
MNEDITTNVILGSMMPILKTASVNETLYAEIQIN